MWFMRLIDRFAAWQAARRAAAHERWKRRHRVIMPHGPRVPDRFPTWKPFQ